MYICVPKGPAQCLVGLPGRCRAGGGPGLIHESILNKHAWIWILVYLRTSANKQTFGENSFGHPQIRVCRASEGHIRSWACRGGQGRSIDLSALRIVRALYYAVVPILCVRGGLSTYLPYTHVCTHVHVTYRSIDLSAPRIIRAPHSLPIPSNANNGYGDSRNRCCMPCSLWSLFLPDWMPWVSVLLMTHAGIWMAPSCHWRRQAPPDRQTNKQTNNHGASSPVATAQTPRWYTCVYIYIYIYMYVCIYIYVHIYI